MDATDWKKNKVFYFETCLGAVDTAGCACIGNCKIADAWMYKKDYETFKIKYGTFPKSSYTQWQPIPKDIVVTKDMINFKETVAGVDIEPLKPKEITWMERDVHYAK